MEKMKIDIWSDIACPYCYIGKRKLEEALNQFPNADDVELVWHSYELNPSLPKKALSKSFFEYFAEQHGSSVDEVKRDFGSIIALAKEVGLDYNFDKLIVANTSDALRLVKLAKKQGLADIAEELLFSAYFVEGKDISDRTVLKKIGDKIGLDQAKVEKLLDSEEFLDEIKEDIRYSEDILKLEYIPFYRFNNKDMIEGSLSVDKYLSTLTEAYNDWKVNGVHSGNGGNRTNGRACSIDGVCSLD